MKKYEALIFIILIFIGAGIIVYKLFYKFDDVSTVTTTTKIVESKSGFELLNSGNYYKEYLINKMDITNIDIKIDSVNIKYVDSVLYLNEKETIEGIDLYRKVYKFEDLFIFNVSYKDYLYDALILYNSIDDTFSIVNKLNNLYLSLNNSSVNDNGILLTTTIVNDKKVITDNGSKDICLYDLKSIDKAMTSTLYIYDPNDNILKNTEEISSMSFESYVTSNNLC